MKPKDIFFDGYNTIGVYAKDDGMTLMRYYNDIHYCGNEKRMYAVRKCGEDIEDFATYAEAKRFYTLAVALYKAWKKGGYEECEGHYFYDILLDTWKAMNETKEEQL